MSEYTDKQLLEWAAKAAGVEGGWGERMMIGGDEVDLTDIWFLDSPDTCAIWDPLEDDGDALRLAVKLEINILPTMEQSSCRNPEYTGWINEDASRNPFAATRRSIVRAAAEIGRAMP